MAQQIGPVQSTANYQDNVYEGLWSSGFVFSQNAGILVELSYGVPGAPGDIIHDVPCASGNSLNFQAPATLEFPDVFITRLRFKSSGSTAATVEGYVGEPRAPGIIAGIGGQTTITSTAMQLISTQIISSPTGLTLLNIPQTFTHLLLVYNASANNVSDQFLQMTFNADGGSDYQWGVFEQLNGASSPSTSGGLTTVMVAGVVGNSSMLYSGTVWIPDYRSTIQSHTIAGQHAGIQTNNRCGTTVGSWNQSAAVTRLDLTAGGGAFLPGSVFSFYGL